MKNVKQIAQNMLKNQETREQALRLLAAIDAVERGTATVAQHGLVLRAMQANASLGREGTRLGNSQN